MVEAAGVEPASEGTSPRDSTCVSTPVFSPPVSERGKNHGRLSVEESYRDPSTRRIVASLLNDVPSHPTGKGEGNVVA